jgi:hypothetical protein
VHGVYKPANDHFVPTYDPNFVTITLQRPPQ